MVLWFSGFGMLMFVQPAALIFPLLIEAGVWVGEGQSKEDFLRKS